MLKKIVYFGLFIISSISIAMEERLSQPEPNNPNEVIFINNVSYNDLGQISKIDQGVVLRSGTKLSGIAHHFLKDEEFDQKLEPFKEMLEKSVLPTRSPCFPPEDTLIIPVIERGAIVRLIEENKAVQLETTGIYRCIGVAAWNGERIGCLHYDAYTDFSSLIKFMDALTDHKRLNQETHFLLVSNYITANLKKMYEFLLTHAPESQILVEVQHEHEGYVINEQSSEQRTQERFYRASETKQYLMEKEAKLKGDLDGKSLFLTVDKTKNISYGFAASEMTESLEPYFNAIDSLGATGLNLPPLEEILQGRQLNISTQPLIFQTIVQKFYAYKGKQSEGLQELCYLYDSLIEIFM